MMNTGQHLNAVLWKLQKPLVNTWLFLAEMKCIGKRDGRIVWMVRIPLFELWFVIRRGPSPPHRKKLVGANVMYLPMCGQDYGGTDVVIQVLQMPASPRIN